MAYDCIVVGGGLIGMLCARELAVSGMSVLLCERRNTGREASWAGGGILSPLYPWRYPASVTALSQWSQLNYHELSNALMEESGIDPEWTLSGLMILDNNNESNAVIDWAQQSNATLEIVRSDALEPSIGIGNIDTVWMPQVAQIRNPRLVKALRGSIQVHGVTVSEDDEVMDILHQHGVVQGVRTKHKKIYSDNVVVAAGAWSAKLVENIGLFLSLQPVRGQMIVLRSDTNKLRKVVLFNDRYVIPRRDGRVLVGSTLEYVGFDKSTTQQAKENLMNSAVALLPVLDKYELEHHWAGLRPGTVDGVPYIGNHPEIKGLFVNAGHFRNGVVLGPASCRLLADLVLSRPPIVCPDDYSLMSNRAKPMPS